MAAAKTDRFMVFSPARVRGQFRLDIDRVQWPPGIQGLALKADRAHVTANRVTVALQPDRAASVAEEIAAVDFRLSADNEGSIVNLQVESVASG
jgi:hypothetical protein